MTTPSLTVPSCACGAHDASLKVLCASCVQKILKSPRERRERARTEWTRVRTELVASKNDSALQLTEYPYRRARLRQRLEQLQQESAAWALLVTQNAVTLQERHARLQQARAQQQVHDDLERLQDTLPSSLQDMAAVSAQRVRRLRFGYACKAYEMHRIQVEDQQSTTSCKQQQPRGIGKIYGLPLPHAGPDLYGVLPPRELRSALRLVASCTRSMALCLDIPLPHPILLHPQQRDCLLGALSTPSATRLPLAKRISYATQLNLAEDPSASATTATNTSRNNDDWNLQLLQNNVMYLCLRTLQSDEAVQRLWPPEALLWNLQQLYRYCHAQVEAY